MPNWCSNSLQVDGDPKDINQLPWKNNKLLLNPILPAPVKGIDTIAKLFPNLDFSLDSSEPGCDWRAAFYWQKGESDYHPEIDLEGNITYSECSPQFFTCEPS